MSLPAYSDQRAGPAGCSGLGEDRWELVFSGLLGATLGLALLKLGNPVIFDRLIDPPTSFWECVYQPWPVAWGYCILACSVAAGLKLARFRKATPSWLVLLPLVWLGWQGVASIKTIDARLTVPTLLHFTACVVCFYTGLFSLSGVRRLWPFWLSLVAAFSLVLWIGLEQHYGGLEASRRFFYEQPNWRQYPPEYLKKIASDRIFSTLVYPNALAGAILLFLPAVLVTIWNGTRLLNPLIRKVVTGLVLYAALACLFWSSSKAGWLVALVVGLLVLRRQSIPQTVKWTLATTVVLAGLTGFFVKFTPYFRKGATSVSARFAYWNAALQTARAHPIFGTGPGTFSIPYSKIKPPAAEMARLTHNDFLEQASDSGIPGFLSYSAFVLGGVAALRRRIDAAASPLSFGVWLGLVGWTLQSFVEFFLFIPALSWTAFTFLGWLWGLADKEE